jgi:hypothetical protein
MVQTHLETVSESPMMVNERRGLVMATKFFFCISRMIVDFLGFMECACDIWQWSVQI